MLVIWWNVDISKIYDPLYDIMSSVKPDVMLLGFG